MWWVQLNILFANSYGLLLASAFSSEHLTNLVQVSLNPILNVFGGYNILPVDIPDVRHHSPRGSLQAVREGLLTGSVCVRVVRGGRAVLAVPVLVSHQWKVGLAHGGAADLAHRSSLPVCTSCVCRAAGVLPCTTSWYDPVALVQPDNPPHCGPSCFHSSRACCCVAWCRRAW